MPGSERVAPRVQPPCVLVAAITPSISTETNGAMDTNAEKGFSKLDYWSFELRLEYIRPNK